MGLRPRAFLAGSLGFAVAFVVACGGGSGLLSSQQAASLNSQLQSVSVAVSSGRCATARGAAQAFDDQVAALPSTVNRTLANNLGQGASTLSQLADRGCTTTSTSTSRSTSTTTSTSTISTTTVTNTTTPKTSTDTGTATNPGGTGSSSTSSNGGAGIGTTNTGQNGQ